jgi:hypothetical protein
MKTLFIFAALMLAVTFGASPLTTGRASHFHQKQKAVMRFNQPIELLGVTLKGEYLFVHDEAAMMRGEACTYVYKGNAEVASKLVVSFRCLPAQRVKVSSFTVRTEQLAPGLSSLREYQYAGDTEAHVVPAPGDKDEQVVPTVANRF